MESLVKKVYRLRIDFPKDFELCWQTKTQKNTLKTSEMMVVEGA